MWRRKVLEAAEDVGGGVGGHAGEVLPVAAELIAEPENDEVDTDVLKKEGTGLRAWPGREITQPRTLASKYKISR